MGEIETTGPGAEAFLQRVLSNDVAADRRRRRAVLASCAARTAACSTTSSPTGSAAERFLTVTNAVQPRARPRLVARPRRGLRRRRSRPHRRLRDARRAGPRGARPASAALADGGCPRASAPRRCTVAGAPGTLVCGTGYTGEDGVELLVAPAHAPAVWDALRRRRRRAGRARRPRHAAPRGLLPPLRQRPHGGARADRGRPGLVLQGGHGLHRRPRRCARVARGRARRRSSSRSRSPARASPRQGNPVVGGGEVTTGTLSPMPGDRHRHGLRPGRAGRAGHGVRDRRPRQDARRRGPQPSRSTRKET